MPVVELPIRQRPGPGKSGKNLLDHRLGQEVIDRNVGNGSADW
jgi:hypothetical protein